MILKQASLDHHPQGAQPRQLEVLIYPVGSAGDVYPLVGLALALRRRGHQVTILTSGYFAGLLQQLDLPFVDVLPADEFLRLANDPKLWHPTRGFRAIFQKAVAPWLHDQYQSVATRYSEGRTLVLTSVLGLGARIAQDKLGVPLITVDLQPAVVWSEYQSPALFGVWRHPLVPRFVRRFQFWLGQTFFLDPVACPLLNEVRGEYGLPPIRHISRWWHSPDCILGLFPEWYAARQPDWPPQLIQADFPLWDERATESLAPHVEGYLRDGDPPIVFTPGSANLFGEDFFQVAADVCRRLGRRGMLCSRFAHHVPPAMPPGVQHFDYVPFSRVLPRAAAVVHHGGIGTTAQSLAAGIPQLIMPISHDQPDNAQRVHRLGVGDSIWPRSFTVPRVASVLSRLLSDTQVQTACQRIAHNIGHVDPYQRALAAIEQYAERRLD